MKLIIATKNEGKLREIKKIMRGINIPVISLNELDRKFRIKENGKTFLENALKKTIPVSKFYKDDYVVGEDSGLEVGCLGGKPGVYSKRYSGKGATDKKNNLKILKALKGVDSKLRKACFCCWLVLLKDAKLVKTFDGKLSGLISEEIRGNSGFGYDPIFYLSKYRKTVAQITLDKKNSISHRAKAFNKLREYLKGLRKKF
ncbi:MAG: RdgB/HAM1 family non-canonical purine NTP pyrophosphatase [Candidatus Omnitrophica bacterium]|nr:RdgB/HAM1 family non-canonical purine NTP pyrophosphatase [Candidatus Omnitrophota bacterium]